MMNRNHPVLVSIAVLFLAALTAGWAPARPNLLFILVDDWGWRDVGYRGSTFYETPEIDQLAEEWARFDHCYTASPMCSPTRISILTGRGPERHGVTQWLAGSERAFTREGEAARVFCPKPQSSGIAAGEVTLGEALAEAGYATAFYGKWHLGSFKATGGPANHGFGEQVAVIEANRCAMFHPFRGVDYFPGSGAGDHYGDLLTDAAIEFVSARREAPFYLHLCYFSMHAPIASKPGMRAKFAKKAAGLPGLEADRTLQDHSHKPQKLRQDDAEYAGQLATLDRNIGRLVQALKEARKLDDTIIFLTGDNGGRSCFFQGHPTSNQPLRAGKTFLFEGGLRTPLLVHWPGNSKPGSTCDVPVTSVDFFPTILEMLGLPARPGQHLDGVSFASLFRGEELARDTFYWHFPHYQAEGSYPSSAIRKGRYKLIHDYHHDDGILFDLEADPEEQRDLSAARPELAAELKRELLGRLEETGAYIPMPRSE